MSGWLLYDGEKQAHRHVEIGSEFLRGADFAVVIAVEMQKKSRQRRDTGGRNG